MGLGFSGLLVVWNIWIIFPYIYMIIYNIYTYIHIYMYIYILGIIIPTDEVIFLRGVGIPPTRLVNVVPIINHPQLMVYYWVCGILL